MMPQAIPITQFTCPRCFAVLAPETPGATACPACRWRGEVHLFSYLPLAATAAEAALPDDATCIHHPRKKATAVCEGTGDYICSLCAVEVNGRTFSAEYLNKGGSETVSKAFERFLPRPDSHIKLYLVLLFVPYVNFVLIAFAFLWIPHAFYLYAKAMRMRAQDPLFRRLMSTTRVVLLPILLVLCAGLWVFVVIGVIAVIASGDL